MWPKESATAPSQDQKVDKPNGKKDSVLSLTAIDYETAVRAAALTNTPYARPAVLFQPYGTNSAIVAWKQGGFQEEEPGNEAGSFTGIGTDRLVDGV